MYAQLCWVSAWVNYSSSLIRIINVALSLERYYSYVLIPYLFSFESPLNLLEPQKALPWGFISICVHTHVWWARRHIATYTYTHTHVQQIFLYDLFGAHFGLPQLFIHVSRQYCPCFTCMYLVKASHLQLPCIFGIGNIIPTSLVQHTKFYPTLYCSHKAIRFLPAHTECMSTITAIDTVQIINVDHVITH